MRLDIFDVEHGACALLTCDDSTTMMLDAGHNATTEWKPGDHLVAKGLNRLDMLVVTNYDEDHVSGIANLLDRVEVSWLSRNKSVSTSTLKMLKSENGMGPGIDRLCDAIDNTFTGDGTAALPSFSGLTRQTFSAKYPTFDDENNLSLINLLDCHGQKVMFTGDLERAGWEELAKDQNFIRAMNETHVLIAPHHGRIAESDRPFMKEFFTKHFTSAFYVVISDKGYAFDTQQTIPIYRSFTKGGPFRGENRWVLTTRKDGHISFQFSAESWGPS